MKNKTDIEHEIDRILYEIQNPPPVILPKLTIMDKLLEWEVITEWEMCFLYDIQDKKKLTERQQNCLERIKNKIMSRIYDDVPL